jgi:hypothetical protein
LWDGKVDSGVWLALSAISIPPSKEVAEVGEGAVKLKNGHEAHVTLNYY